MSRKSRQKGARNRLSRTLPFTWLSVVLLVAGLWMGALGLLGPWISQPTPYEETIPVSATLAEVKGEYRYRRNHRRLRNIQLCFDDHEQLKFDRILANDTLLEKLEAYPAGTVFDMRLEPNGSDVMALSVDGVEVFSYEAACRAIRVNNVSGMVWGIFALVMAGYAAWSLIIRWRYRRLNEQNGA